VTAASPQSAGALSTIPCHPTVAQFARLANFIT